MHESQLHFYILAIIRKFNNRGAWLAQSEERVTLNLGVVSLSPTLGVEITKKNNNKLKKKENVIRKSIYHTKKIIRYLGINL